MIEVIEEVTEEAKVEAGKRVRLLRKLMGMTQKELRLLLKIDQSRFSQMENGIIDVRKQVPAINEIFKKWRDSEILRLRKEVEEWKDNELEKLEKRIEKLESIEC